MRSNEKLQFSYKISTCYVKIEANFAWFRLTNYVKIDASFIKNWPHHKMFVFKLLIFIKKRNTIRKLKSSTS